MSISKSFILEKKKSSKRDTQSHVAAKLIQNSFAFKNRIDFTCSEPYIYIASDDFGGLSQKRVILVFDSLESTLPENTAITMNTFIYSWIPCRLSDPEAYSFIVLTLEIHPSIYLRFSLIKIIV